MLFAYLTIFKENELEIRQSMGNHNFDDENSEVMKQNAILLRRNSIQGND